MQFGVNLVALGGVLGTLMITRQLLFGGFQRDDLVPAGDSRVQIGSVRGIENRLRAQSHGSSIVFAPPSAFPSGSSSVTSPAGLHSPENTFVIGT